MVLQKDPKDKGLKLWAFIFWVFLHDLDDPNDQVWTRLKDEVWLLFWDFVSNRLKREPGFVLEKRNWKAYDVEPKF